MCALIESLEKTCYRDKSPLKKLVCLNLSRKPKDTYIIVSFLTELVQSFFQENLRRQHQPSVPFRLFVVLYRMKEWGHF